MDEIDKKIILLLQEDARMTITDMTEHLNLSRPSITERLKRLHDAGIIEKYTARISPEAVGKSIQAFLRIESLKIPCKHFEKIIYEEHQILECHRVTGESCYYLKVAVRSMKELEKLIDIVIPFGTVKTSMILSSPIPYRPIIVDENKKD
ncbi:MULTISPECIES: Lrp/AsnC family transcriptional regulator [Bacillus cereus group]|uniref:Transcriptional regulator, Lrp/AsnC family n=2 Tax=Bacillus cytotoxicus TaxID=580165 RepID=A0AAX2CHG0_9BACI|nr:MULTISPECIES: Lrp/AsnC family transcriptional regulator [Bacillus cereus group]ABS22232.1 putative transcriptional regulator, AsnC family [Bacillus cytotoxicus NVH 391-98]AWC28845.1 Lrp/AsnC family transcriptional regulator [Bacillus cytotoxicus]AWC32848.1 Lrp/AsnC family transcriptional regulator [Bacillus cytotoxicus]AWC36874.1 Lrp/AsnC family transcriptional regulator [Bacillus cytotoxicus]AWC39770.1 Lrp/AsnC family transcriptional regulator [Bacillus cytotoxicus]